MRAEFVREGSPEEVAGVATWDAGHVDVTADDDRVREALAPIFRPTPVIVDDPALRSAGTRGPVVLPPGSLRWFEAAAAARSGAEGLRVRLVPDATPGIGWDPAGAYRPFSDVVDRMGRTR